MHSVPARSLLRAFSVPIVVIGAGVMPALAGISPHLRLVALTGQPAPGTPPGTLFSLFGPAEFDGAPRIGADSTIGFAGTLSDGTAGFWLDHGAGAELLAHSGTAAPGTEPGVVFRQRISEAILFSPPQLVPGHAVLFNTLTGPGIGFTNDEGIWGTTGSGLSLMARDGAPAASLAGVRLGGISLRALDNAGRAIFSTLLNGAVVEQNNESIWRTAPDGTLELIVREGQAAPEEVPVGVVFANPSTPSTFPIIIGNVAGDLLFQGNLHGPGTNFNNDEALFIRSAAAGTRLFIRKGDPVPGMPGFLFGTGSTSGFNTSDMSLNNNAKAAIVARVDDGTRVASALLSNAGGTLATLARSGDPAPGANAAFDFLVGPVMNTHADIAFTSTTPTSGGTKGLWIHSAGALRALAIPGQQVPGQPAGTMFQDVIFINGFNDDGFVLFTAGIFAPHLGTALLLADPAGNVAILAHVQSDINVTPGDRRTVSQIITRPDSLSDNAHAAFAIRFTDGSVAQFDASLVDQTPPCLPDINQDGLLNSGDFFDFLALFFPGEPAADFDHDGVVNSQDFFAFLTAFFQGC